MLSLLTVVALVCFLLSGGVIGGGISRARGVTFFLWVVVVKVCEEGRGRGGLSERVTRCVDHWRWEQQEGNK